MGWFFVLLGLLCNRFLIARFFIPDGSIESPLIDAAILFVQAILIGYGALMLRNRQSVWVGRIGRLFGMVISLLVTLFLLNFLLGKLGFPSENIPQIAHPPNFGYPVENVEFNYPFVTNSLGLRDAEIPLVKPSGTTRIVVLGDSFTEGAGVAMEQTYLSELERRFAAVGQEVDLISCALSGTGPLKQARLYFNVCNQYDPDLVLWALHPNDVTETVPDTTVAEIDIFDVERKGIAKISHMLWPRLTVLVEKVRAGEGANTTADSEPPVITMPNPPRTAVPLSVPVTETVLVKAVVEEANKRSIPQAEIDAWVNGLPLDLLTASEDDLFNGYILASGLLNPSYWTESFNLTGGYRGEEKTAVMFSLMDEVIARLKADNTPVAVVLIPSAFQYDSRYGNVWANAGVAVQDWSTASTAYEQRIASWAAQHNLPYLSLTPNYQTLIAQQPDGWYYPIDGHWTPAGHVKAAEFLWPFVNLITK